jgi:hypothetical protein
MHSRSTAIISLANHLDAAGIGGAEPIFTARALLDKLARQPGAEEPDHVAAHIAIAVQTVQYLGIEQTRDMLAEAEPEHAGMVLARLVMAGVPDREIKEYLPRAAA